MMDYQISIHAPARGATAVGFSVYYQRDDFNPRSREGSDHAYKTGLNYVTDFNPRSREGSDGTGNICRAYIFNFNPRSREGSDGLPTNLSTSFTISIHAPARGATVR